MVTPQRASKRPADGSEQVVDQVTADLRERILSRQLAPSARLNQSQLAEELRVSRIPVRDALQRLVHEGLVIRGSAGGLTVAPMSLDDLQDLYDLRITLEPRACELATPRLGRAGVVRMTRSLEALDGADDTASWMATHDRFHAELYRESGRPRLNSVVATLRQQADRYVRLLLSDRDTAANVNEEHHKILDAVRNQDAAAVAALTTRHLENAHDSLTHLLLDVEASQGAPTS